MRSPPAHSLIACALGLMTACADDPTAPVTPPVTTPPVWSEVDGLPPSSTLYALWVPREDYAIGVGPRGQVMRWDGLQWAVIDNEGTHNLYAITGSTGGETVAVGDGGEIVRFDGTRFVKVYGPTTQHLRGLWTPGGNAFTSVGTGGVIVRGDGATWTQDTSPVTTPLFAVWGPASDDVFAVGLNGVILHYDGMTWSEMNSGTTALLAAVSGTAADNVYAVGEAGTVLHFDGASWTPMESGTRELLQGVSAGNTTLAVGSNGAMISLDGTTWTPEPALTHEWLYATAQSGSRIWAVGSRAILARSSNGWKPETRGAVPLLNGVTGPPWAALRVVGNEGYVARKSGDSWKWEDTGNVRTINAAWCAPGGDVFAVGRNRIMHHDGIAWVEEYNSPGDLFDVGGGPSGIYAVGAGGTVLLRLGGVWMRIGPTAPVSDDLHAYVSVTSDWAYIVGANGRILAYNGTAWVTTSAHAPALLYDAAVGPDPGTAPVIAVGSSGAIFGISSTGVWPMASPTSASLYALSRGPGGRLYAAGQGGVILSYDGTVWSVVASPTLKTLRSAWFDGESLFLAGGEASSGPALLRYGPP